jgi:hypothetical protein
MASNEVERQELSAKEILMEFAQALHMTVKAGQFLLKDDMLMWDYAHELVPSISQLSPEDHNGAVESVKGALETCTEKLDKLSTAILAFLS